ncbi:MAG: triose-phosphate isomerase [Tannerellaceae bacterium]|jgi:triosephosphate isomerase|nr:triose-phosphate isomerase [Tannerellaceae bacterium]
MQKLILGNWKMNGSKSNLESWFSGFFKNVTEFEKTYKGEASVVLICVPAIFIEYAQNLADEYNLKTKNIKVNIGSQDIHFEDKGAFTGNTSALFIKDFGIKYTLVGHSERRQYEGETSELVAKKSANAVRNGITPIICVGEPLEVREKRQHLAFVKDQTLDSVKNVDLSKIIIAYEPVWAIGTGKVPTPDDIEEINSYIKKTLTGSGNVAVVYGGSVKSSNAKEIMSLKSVDGVLVGGGSLNGEEFSNIAFAVQDI